MSKKEKTAQEDIHKVSTDEAEETVATDSTTNHEVEETHDSNDNVESLQEELPPEELRSKLQEAEVLAQENYNKYLRGQADFDNFRRRMRKEREEQLKYAAQPLIEQLLPALDNFERALSAGEDTHDTESIVKGVKMVLGQVEQALKDVGLEPIATVGEPFDPQFHEAVMTVEDDQFESGVIVEEMQKGYQLKDRVIRPAMVKVNA